MLVPAMLMLNSDSVMLNTRQHGAKRPRGMVNRLHSSGMLLQASDMPLQHSAELLPHGCFVCWMHREASAAVIASSASLGELKNCLKHSSRKVTVTEE